MDGGGRVAVVVGAVVTVALQLVLAPNIVLFGALPNFLLGYVLVISLVRADSCGPALPFLLGLLFDLAGGGPVGACALLFVLASLLVSRAYMALDNDTLFMPVALIVGTSVLFELLYGVLVIACGQPVGLVEAFVYRALPCAAYDCVLALVMYPLGVRFLSRRGVQQPGGTLSGKH